MQLEETLREAEDLVKLNAEAKRYREATHESPEFYDDTVFEQELEKAELAEKKKVHVHVVYSILSSL